MKYFITGGAGFIGSTMTEKLLNNSKNEVTVFDNFISGQSLFIEQHFKNKNFNLIEGDLLDFETVKKSVKGHDFIFHFAANPDISKAMTEPDLDLKLGIIATFNLVEAMRLNGIKQIAYSSGSGVYGDVGLTETPENFGPLLPSSMYGASKLGAEGIISAFCYMFDMQAWMFRFANVVGKNQTHGVGYDFIKKLKEDPQKLNILGDGEQSKSYIHITDVIEAMLFVINKANDIVNVFNIATDDYLTVNEIAKIVVKEMGLNSVVFKYTGSKKGWKGDIPIVRFNLGKIHKLGWKAKYNSREALEMSIREMLRKYSSIVRK